MKTFATLSILFFISIGMKLSSQPITTLGTISTCGTNASIPVSASNFTNVQAFQFYISYNPAIATPLDGFGLITWGPALSSLGGTRSMSVLPGGLIQVFFSIPDVCISITGTPVLFYINFNKFASGTTILAFDDVVDDNCFYACGATVYQDDASSYISGSLSFTDDANTWTGATNSWATATNWGCGSVPGLTSNIVIPNVSNDPVISATTGAHCNNMNIATGATVTIQSEGTNSGSLIINGAISGTGASEKFLTYNRYMRADGYQYFSSPVSGQNLTGWSSGATVYDWSEPGGVWAVSSDVTFKSGKGYSWTHPSAAGTVAFTGNYLNSASVLTTSPFSSGPVAGDDLANYNALALVSGRSRVDATWGAGGWNLLGNPFTSSMVPSVFISTNAASFDPNYKAVYVYAGNEGSGGVYYYYDVDGDDGATAGWSVNPFGDALQVGQGFFVLAKNNSTAFTFANTMQTHSTGTALKAAQTPSSPGFRLKARFGTTESSTLVIYNDQMTVGLDPGYDIGFLSAGQDVEIFTALAKDNGFDFTRQLLPLTGNEKNIIPVGVNSEIGGVVTFSAFIVPIQNGTFYLEDRLAGKFTDLSKDTYTVTLPAKTAGTGRFYIHASMVTGIQPQIANTGELTLRIWTSQNKLNIEGAVSAKATGAIYDMLGRKIYEVRLTGAIYNTITVPAAVSGVYLVKITDGNKVAVSKVVF
jgi:hypothetical protein